MDNSHDVIIGVKMSGGDLWNQAQTIRSPA